jgi:hypothetical protein
MAARPLRAFVVISLMLVCRFPAKTQQSSPGAQPGSPTYADVAYVGVEQRRPVAARSVTEDLSYGGSFIVSVAPNLPRVTFRIIPDVQPNDQFGNATSTIRDVEVFSGDSLEPMQHLTGCEWFGMEAPPRGEEWFRAVDFNFDGYQDIYIMMDWGATGNNQGCIWLYDPETRRFNYSKEFSELGTFTLDRQHKTIITWANGGMAGGVHSTEKYKIAENHPVLIYDEKQEWDMDKKQFHCIVKELRGTQMVTTHDDWGRTALNSGPAACDHANRIF